MKIDDCIFFDIRALHESLNITIPKHDIHRYTLRMVKEDGLIEYRGDWAKEERNLMEKAGYKNGDKIEGVMFPELWSAR